MAVAPDGSPIEVYRRLPPLGEPELIGAAVPAGATVLELGAGAGRLTRPLVGLGYRVTAVDNSAEMLGEIGCAETLLSDIETLDLGRRFDCVLLASHFVNEPDEGRRRRVLGACARHVERDGRVLIEAYPPGLDWRAGRETVIGDVAIRLAEASLAGTLVRATMEYEVAGQIWRQPFAAELLDDDALEHSLAPAGLAFECWLDRDRGWLAACAT
jgi:SAM-dependent methyltransferase